MNPLGRGNVGPQTGQNPISMMLSMLDKGKSPDQLIQTMVGNNPQIQAAVNQLRDSANGKNPKDIAMEMAKQKGIDPAQLQQLARRMGLK